MAKYNITIEVPDELLAVLGILKNPEVKSLQQDLDLKPVSAAPAAEPDPTSAPAMQVTATDLVNLAKQVCEYPDLRDAARAAITELGYQKLAQVKEEHWSALYVKLTKILSVKSNQPA